MRPSYFVLYSAVATQAAAALLLACALFVLGRFYPRWFLRLWAGAWLAESLHVAFGIVALVWRTPNGAEIRIAPNLATWASQTAGYAHVALLLMGALALYRGQTKSSGAWATAVGAAALLALIPTFAVPQDASPDATSVRLLVRVGLLAIAAGGAAIATAMLIRVAHRRGPSLGARWMWAILLAIGLHRFVVLLVATTRFDWAPTRGAEMLQALPLIEILLMAALGIGTAIALVEDEQEVIRHSAERQVEAERRARAVPTNGTLAVAWCISWMSFETLRPLFARLPVEQLLRRLQIENGFVHGPARGEDEREARLQGCLHCAQKKPSGIIGTEVKILRVAARSHLGFLPGARTPTQPHRQHA